MTATLQYEEDIAEITLSSGGRTGKFKVSVYANEGAAFVALYGAWNGRCEGMAMRPEQAEELAGALTKAAAEAKEIGGFTVTFASKRAVK